jgi:hypothetical protein
MTTIRAFGTFFGEPWPSGICDDGIQVETPVGEDCELCNEPIDPHHQGSFIGTEHGLAPMHKECSLRSVLGGIGHLDNHHYWCLGEHDPDAGYGYRRSALMVWDWVADHGFPTKD